MSGRVQTLFKRGDFSAQTLAYGLGSVSGYAVSFYVSASVEGVQGDYFLRDELLVGDDKKYFWIGLRSSQKLSSKRLQSSRFLPLSPLRKEDRQRLCIFLNRSPASAKTEKISKTLVS